jgi:predicted permease
MWMASGLLLVVACINAAHLVMFRALERRRIHAIRIALGAPWRVIAVETLAESTTLVGAASLLGMMAGWISLRLVLKLRPSLLASLDSARFDWRVALASTALAALLILVVSGVSLWRASRSPDAPLLLRDMPFSPSITVRRSRAVLVATEIGFAAMLLFTGTRLFETLRQLETVDLGFVPVGLVAVRLDPGMTSGLSLDERRRFTADLAIHTQRIPGVVAVASGDNVPPSLGYVHGAMQSDGGLSISLGPASMTQINRVSPGYFVTAGIRIITGTTFRDTSSQSPEVIINETGAKLLWPQGSAIGHHMRLGPTAPWKRVVGVVADAAFAGPYVERHQPAVFEPQADGADGWILARLRRGSGTTSASLSAILSSGHRTSWLLQAISEAAVLDAEVAPVRFAAAVVNCFGLLTVVLSAVGLSSVLTYSVALRRREIGIRMAHGATAGRVALDTLAYGAGLVCAGGTSGLIGGHWMSTLLSAFVPLAPSPGFGTYVALMCVLLIIGFAACAGPALLAARTAPGTVFSA